MCNLLASPESTGHYLQYRCKEFGCSFQIQPKQDSRF